MQHRAAAAPTRRWGFVCALARTWQTVEGQALPDLGPQRPRTYAQRPRVPRLAGAPGGKTFWSLRHRRWLRPLGDVTVVRRKKGRTVGPNPPQILVTTRDAWTPRQVGGADPRSGPVEQSHRALKTALGLGAPHVGREAGRIEPCLWHGSAGVWVADPCVPSGPPPWQAMECRSAAACLSLARDPQPSGAPYQGEAGKRL